MPPPQVSVLIVDDEPALANTYRMLLEEEGYSVSTCTSYECGQRHLKEKSYDAALIEIDLGTSQLGLQLAQDAKKLRKAPLVILSTGNPTSEHLRKALQLQVDYLLLKPSDAEEVTSFLHRGLARRELLKDLARQNASRRSSH